MEGDVQGVPQGTGSRAASVPLMCMRLPQAERRQPRRQWVPHGGFREQEAQVSGVSEVGPHRRAGGTMGLRVWDGSCARRGQPGLSQGEGAGGLSPRVLSAHTLATEEPPCKRTAGSPEHGPPRGLRTQWWPRRRAFGDCLRGCWGHNLGERTSLWVATGPAGQTGGWHCQAVTPTQEQVRLGEK